MKVKRHNSSLIVTDRDTSILTFLYEQKIATFNQIGRRFFNGAKKQTISKRMSKLAKAKLIEKVGAAFQGNLNAAYRITDQGLKLIVDSYPHRIGHPRLLSDSIAHDLGLVEVRERLNRCKSIVSFITENALQTCEELADDLALKDCIQLHSDAALLVETPSGTYRLALEYEESEKTLARYVSKLRDYYLSPSIAAVLYVCGSGRIGKQICQADELAGQDSEPKVYWCREDIIHKAKGKLPFHNRSGGVFCLD